MKFYYASADSDPKHWRLEQAKASHRLTTYYLLDGSIAANSSAPSRTLLGDDPAFIHKRDTACAKSVGLIKDQKYLESLAMDSGAWTYMQPKNKVSNEALMAYVERYTQHCADNKDLFTWCAEMDVDRVYGMKFVEDAWSLMVSSGVPAIRVWHTWRGVDVFRDYCNEALYVGVGGPYPDERDMSELLYWAYKNGNRVHVFGRLNYLLHNWACYSADAISWLSPEAWGQVIKFDSSKGTLLRKTVNKTGLDMDSLSAIAGVRQRGFQHATISAVREMQKYENYLTRSWAERGVTFDEPTVPQRWIK